MSVAEFFTVTPGTAPNTVIVQGTVGRYADMRTVWLEETPGRFVALDKKTSEPITYAYDSTRRVLVEQDGINWSMGIFVTRATRFASTDRDAALARATADLHE